MTGKKLNIWAFFILLSTLCYSQQPIQWLNLDIISFKDLIKSTDQQPTVINFWASWCGPCMEELPYFARLKNKYPELRVVLINLDFQKDFQLKVLPTLNPKYAHCEIARFQGITPDDWMPLVDNDWSGAIPGTLILKSNQHKFIDGKFSSFDDLESYLLKF